MDILHQHPENAMAEVVTHEVLPQLVYSLAQQNRGVTAVGKLQRVQKKRVDSN